MDFDIPAELAAYLLELDDFIEREIKPLEQQDDNIRFFDHRREYARFDTLLTQWKNQVGEDDLSTLPEILATHDISRDGGALNPAYFHARSLDNYKNRCLHHYVYSVPLLREIGEWLGCRCVYTTTQGLDIWFILTKGGHA